MKGGEDKILYYLLEDKLYQRIQALRELENFQLINY